MASLHKQDTRAQLRAEEVSSAIRSMIALKHGFAEPHKLSRHLQKCIAHYDMDVTGKVSSDLFRRAMESFQLPTSKEDLEQVFERYSGSGGQPVKLRTFCDNIFAISPYGSVLSNVSARQSIELIREACRKRARSFLSNEGSETGVSRCVGVLRCLMDQNKDSEISRSEFVDGLERSALFNEKNLTPQQQETLFQAIDVNGSGTISLPELIRAICGDSLNSRRTKLIRMAFETIAINDSFGNLVCSIREIKKHYNASANPLVISGQMTEDEVYTEFLQSFGDKDKNGVLTWEEFLEYYSNVSVEIQLDDYFELVVRNAWHLSGGEGWCENTTCRRVLVIFTDGRQKVVEIENDLGVSKNDLAKIYQKLKDKGILDIAEISFHAGF